MLARSKRPLTGADESVLKTSALTDGTGAWSVQTAAARSTSSMRQSVFAAAKARLASFFARFGLSLSEAAGIGAGVCVFLIVSAVLARRRWLYHRQLALERTRASLRKQVLVIGAVKGAPAGATVAFDNPLLQRPREGRLKRAAGSVRHVLPPTPAAHSAARRAGRTTTTAASGRGRATLGALGLPPPAPRRAPDAIQYRGEVEEEEGEEEKAAAPRGHAKHSHRFAAAPLVAGRFSAATAAAAAAAPAVSKGGGGGNVRGGGGGTVRGGGGGGGGGGGLGAAASATPAAPRHADDNADD